MPWSLSIDDACLHNLADVAHLAPDVTGHDAALDIMEDDLDFVVTGSHQPRDQPAFSQRLGGRRYDRGFADWRHCTWLTSQENEETPALSK